MATYNARWRDAAASAHGMHPREGGFVAMRRADDARMTPADVEQLLERFASLGAVVRHAWSADGRETCFALGERLTEQQMATLAR